MGGVHFVDLVPADSALQQHIGVLAQPRDQVLLRDLHQVEALRRKGEVKDLHDVLNQVELSHDLLPLNYLISEGVHVEIVATPAPGGIFTTFALVTRTCTSVLLTLCESVKPVHNGIHLIESFLGDGILSHAQIGNVLLQDTYRGMDKEDVFEGLLVKDLNEEGVLGARNLLHRNDLPLGMIDFLIVQRLI